MMIIVIRDWFRRRGGRGLLDLRLAAPQGQEGLHQRRPPDGEIDDGG